MGFLVKRFWNFDQTVNYSSVNEDARSELRALTIGPHDTVLCITGSGARTLDLLTAKPRRIVSIDMNRLQNFLLALKMAATRLLQYDEYLAFLGVRAASDRRQTYDILRDQLSQPARAYWDQRRRDIDKGVYFQGRWERYYRQLAVVLKWWRPRKLQQLFSAVDLESQLDYYMHCWDSRSWQWFVKLVCRRGISRVFFRDPAFYQFVPRQFKITEYILERIGRSFAQHLARENFFISLLFLNQFVSEDAFPIHLQRRHYETLRQNLSAIEPISQPVQQYLHSATPKSIDKFSLSDISSYTNCKEYEVIWQGILSAAKSGAIVCLRHFLVKRSLPKFVQNQVHRYQELEERLEHSDLSAFYSFTVTRIL